jgi:hypothetical protein
LCLENYGVSIFFCHYFLGSSLVDFFNSYGCVFDPRNAFG